MTVLPLGWPVLCGRRFRLVESGRDGPEHLRLRSGGVVSGAERFKRWRPCGEGVLLEDEAGRPGAVLARAAWRADGGLVLRDAWGTRSLDETLPDARPPHRVAVLLRSHKAPQRTLEALQALSGSAAYDLFLCWDATGCEPPPAWPATVTHDLDRLARLGLRLDVPQLLWRCGDYPLHVARAELPGYALYIQLDYDIAFPRGGVTFLEALLDALARRPALPALIASWLGPRWPGWAWAAAARRRFEVVQGCLLAFLAVTPEALDVILRERRAEAALADLPAEGIMNAEALMPSTLHSLGLECVDLNRVLPGCIGEDSFRPGIPDLSTPNFLAARATRDFPERFMIHPALDSSEYAARAWVAAGLGRGRAVLEEAWRLLEAEGADISALGAFSDRANWPGAASSESS